MRLVLFDLDGTLIDSRRTITESMTAAFAEAGLTPPTPEATAGIVGASLPQAIGMLGPDLDPEGVAAIAARYRAAYLELSRRPEADPLFPGIPEVLEALDERGVLLGLATGKSRGGVDAVLLKHGLSGRFVTVQTGDGGPSKPHPDVVLRGLRETGVDARNAVMVGDATFDVLAARAARVGAIGVTWGFQSRADLEGAGADAVVDRPETLVSTILDVFETHEGGVG